MAPAPDLDDELQAKVLSFVSEPKACLSCHTWKQYLYDTLQLEPRIHFMQRLTEKGNIAYNYSAVRPLGEDFEESVGFYFEFSAKGTYKLMWNRTFDAWSSQCEQQVGSWTIFLDHLCCETAVPTTEISDTEVRYAPPGFRFSVAIADILEADAAGGFNQAKDGSPPKAWELPARTGKVEDESFRTDGMWQPMAGQIAAETPVQHTIPVRPDARYVDIDGEVHEVSGDIVENWPEEQWPRLMRCRLRFGING